jgi:hypothetical protein
MGTGHGDGYGERVASADLLVVVAPDDLGQRL